MPDNLLVSIGIDNAKLKTDIDLMKAQLRQATQEVKKLSDEAVKTGDTSRLQQANQGIQALNTNIRTSSRTLREQQVALDGVARASTGAARGLHAAATASAEMRKEHLLSTREVLSLSREIGKLEVNTFSLAKAFREIPSVAIGLAAAGAAVAAVGKVVDSAKESISTLEDLHQATGRSKEDIIAMEKAFREANVDAKLVEPTMRKISEDFTKAHTSAAAMGDALSGVMTMRGGAGDRGPGVLAGGATQPSGFAPGGTMVLRGDKPIQLDVTKGLAGLVDPARYRLDAEGQRKWQEDALRILAQIATTNRQLALEIARAQVPGAQPEQALRALLQSRQPGGAPGFDPRVSEEATRRAEELGIAQKNAAKAIEDVGTVAGTAAMPGTTQTLDASAAAAKSTAQTMQNTFDNMGAAWQKTANEVAAGIPNDQVQSSAGIFESTWTDAFQGIGSAWRSMVNSLTGPSAEAPLATAPIPPIGRASGGLIPGSGTSDTVAAMLTPGEYVARRSSVDYYGHGIFSALNNRMVPRDLFSRVGFAAGGLVGNASFAEGGLVGGSTPVHVHIGGADFPMRAADSVASALIVTARREQMRSAGVKPSWYGARPGA
jgi:hypothetical protein